MSLEDRILLDRQLRLAESQVVVSRRAGLTFRLRCPREECVNSLGAFGVDPVELPHGDFAAECPACGATVTLSDTQWASET